MRSFCLALVGFVALLVSHSSGHAGTNGRSIQLVVDNSAALQGAEIAESLKRQMSFHVSELRKRSEFKTARVHIISINNPRNLWVGTPVELFRNGAGVPGQIAVVQNGCADVLGALDQLLLNVELERPERVDVYVFSSLIHTGSPCDKVTIELPQPVPKNLDLSKLAKENIRVRFYFVHPLQVRPWAEAIRQAGLKSWSIHDEETTRTILRRGLEP